MENMNLESLPSNDQLSQKIEKIKEKYAGESMFPIGKIEEISFSDLGEVLSLKVTGDVPTSFKDAEIVIVHPDARKEGWIGKGKIGFLSAGRGVLIDKIPLPWETLHKIGEIYQEYTGKEYRQGFYPEENTDRFTEPGMITSILEKSK